MSGEPPPLLLLPAVAQPVRQIIGGCGCLKPACAFTRQPSHNGVGQACQPVKPGGPHQFHGTVDRGMGPGFKEQQLCGAHAQDNHGVALFAGWRAVQQISEDQVKLACPAQTGCGQQPHKAPVAVIQPPCLPQRLVKMTPVFHKPQNLKALDPAVGPGRLARCRFARCRFAKYLWFLSGWRHGGYACFWIIMGAYKVLWTHDSLLDESKASNLEAGKYKIEVTDNYGISKTMNFSIEEPDPLNATLISVENTLCADSKDGSVDLYITGGTGSYYYDWNDYTIPQIKNPSLGKGIYELKVSDMNGCKDTVFVEIESPDSLKMFKSSFLNDTSNTCEGELTIIASGGVSPYTYIFDGEVNILENTFENLCKGIIKVN